MLKKVFTFGSVTFLARMLGLLRDTIVAYTLGAQGMSDVFLAAFRLPNLFRAYFAEGALGVSFVPMYSQKLVNNEEAKHFADNAFSTLVIMLFTLCLMLYVFMPNVMKFFAPGFLGGPYKFALTVELSRIMLPYLLFFSTASFIGGIMQAHESFFITAISPVVLNLSIIFSAALPFIGLPVYYFSAAVAISGIVQFFLALYVASRQGIFLRLRMPKLNDDIKVFLKRAGMTLFSGCTMQIGIWINTVFASYVPCAVSYFYYADRVNQLPQALIGVSMSTVLLPTIAKLARKGETPRMIEMQNHALDIGLTFVFPATVTLVAASDAVLKALLNYGQFDYWAITNTVPVLSMLATSLPSFVISKILLLFFYTRGEFKIPAIFSCLTLALNALLNYFMMKIWGHVGIAVAASIASWVNVVFLIAYLKSQCLYKVSDALINKLTYVFLASTAMFLVVSILKTILAPFFFQGFLVKISSLVVLVASGLLAYFATLNVVFRQKLAVEISA